MKNSIPFIALFMYTLIVGFKLVDRESDTLNIVQDDPAKCMEKYDSGWGNYFEDCPADYKDSYFVKMRNTCDIALDVKCCVQQEFKSWKCTYKENIQKGDTIEVHACSGNGKYLFWAREAGDTEIILPSNEEIDNTYKD